MYSACSQFQSHKYFVQIEGARLLQSGVHLNRELVASRQRPYISVLTCGKRVCGVFYIGVLCTALESSMNSHQTREPNPISYWSHPDKYLVPSSVSQFETG